MLGLGYIDKDGLLESSTSPEIISFEKESSILSKVGLASKIAEIGNRLAENSKLIKEVHPAIIEGNTGFEVILRNKVRPTNLQGDQNSKKYLKLDLSKEGTVWQWEEGKDPTVSVFTFKLFSNRSNDELIPVGASAFAGKSGKNYVRSYHPNVHDSGSICMGGYSGHEHIAELSIRGLVNMLTNEAIYSSYRKPNIMFLKTKTLVHIDSSTINQTIAGKTDSKSYDLLRTITTVEEWL